MHRLPTLLFALATAHLAVSSSAATERPNILWVVSEDNTFNYVGPYGDTLARTPAINALAAEGVTFDHAYCPCPVCAPTRSTIITGRYAVGLGTQHMRSQRPLPEGVKFFPEYLRSAGYFCTNNAKTDYNTSTPFDVAWNENGPTAHWRHRPAGAPFFAVFNFAQSHESNLHRRKPLTTDPAKVRVPAYLPDTTEVRADLAQYYDDVSRADAALGKVLEQLKADGLAEDTIIFYYSDNGGCVSRSKRFLYDNGTHIALVTAFPKKFSAFAPTGPGTHSSEIVNFVDLAPTTLSLAGLEVPAQFEGRAFAGAARRPAPSVTFLFRDRMDERYDFARAVTDGNFHYIRNYYPDQPWGQHQNYQWRQSSQREWQKLYEAGKLNATQRAFFESKRVEELYDDRADPDNVRNLVNDPAYAAVRDRLRTALRTEILRTRDTGFMPEPMMIALANGRSPTLIAAQPSVYPLEAILDFVDRAQLSREVSPAAIAQAQHASQPMLRYWAAVCAQRASALGNDFAALLADRDPVVRLAAAETMLDRAENDQAWKVVEEALSDSSQLQRQVFALNTVARIHRKLNPKVQAQVVAFAKLGQKEAEEDYLVEASRPILEAASRAH